MCRESIDDQCRGGSKPQKDCGIRCRHAGGKGPHHDFSSTSKHTGKGKIQDGHWRGQNCGTLRYVRWQSTIIKARYHTGGIGMSQFPQLPANMLDSVINESRTTKDLRTRLSRQVIETGPTPKMEDCDFCIWLVFSCLVKESSKRQ